MITEVDKKIAAALNKGEEYWTFKEDAERDYVHGLFAYPAMMVPKMQREILDVFDHQLAWSHTPTIYDPFMGSGTILVEGMLKGYNIVGVDINPLAYLVAKVKTEIYSLNRLRKSINVLFERIKNANDVEVATDFDNIQKWFKPEIIRELDLIKQQIKYYQNTAFDKEEEKKRAIVASFESEYTGNILPDSKSVKVKKGELVKKCDLKDLVFTVNPKYIPVNINGTEYCDVLRDICTYRIPLGTIQGLKVRQNQKFSMENGASMSISNERITFTFPKDVEHTFFYAAALDQKVSFSLVASPKLTLTIAYE